MHHFGERRLLSWKRNRFLEREVENLSPIIVVIIGLTFGLVAGVGVWLALRGRIAGPVDTSQADIGRLNDELRKESAARAAAEEKNSRIGLLETELGNRDASIKEASERLNQLQKESTELIKTRAELQTTLEQERNQNKQQTEQLQLQHDEIRALDQKRFEEQKADLDRQREELVVQFENIANKILEDKSKKFTDQNKTNLDALLKPLGEKIKDFEKKVEETYDKESKQRFSLEKEISNLRDLNTRIGQDAINLTNALKGQTKTQGNWGEQILETILQNAGMIKGQHYDVQVSINTDEGRRVQPDVILHLPEERHIVIDSKVNLTSYVRYCEMEDGPEREAELKKHIAAFRNHVAELSSKEYQDHYKLSSLEFVLMFVPLEPAFMLALQADESIYDFAYQKRISIVTPSTLHAAVHTVSNIWRQDSQNKNAMKIADEAGKLFDKFVAFTNDLEDIGTKLTATQKSFDSAHNKLISGKGNLIGRVENIRLLGAKASKRLTAKLLDSSDDDKRIEESDGEEADSVAG